MGLLVTQCRAFFSTWGSLQGTWLGAALPAVGLMATMARWEKITYLPVTSGIFEGKDVGKPTILRCFQTVSYDVFLRCFANFCGTCDHFVCDIVGVVLRKT